jgi:DNA-binding NtrC family response regulator
MRVLVVGRDTEARVLRARVLREAGFDVAVPSNYKAAMAAIEAHQLRAIILCESLSAESITDLAQTFRRKHPRGTIVAVTDDVSDRLSQEVDRIVPSSEHPKAIVDVLLTTPPIPRPSTPAADVPQPLRKTGS